MKKTNKKLLLGIWCLLLAVVLVINISITQYALSWDKALTGYFGTVGGSAAAGSSKDYETLEDLQAAQKALELEIVNEGTVLLKNENNALPLEKGSKVSVFGQTAQMWMTKEKITNTKDTVFLESLEAAGLEINGSLRKFYKQSKHTNWGIGANLGDGGIAGTWTVDEVPQSEYTQAVKDSYADYNDAAIVVFSRGGSEGGDLPRDMERFGGEAGQGYLELSKDEKDLLAAVKEAGFEKTIVVLHTCNAMQMDFVNKEEYGIDAVLWVSGTGEDGVETLGKLFVGDVNPSGRTVDTFVYDNLSTPAMQNFGDYRFTQNGTLIDVVTTTVGGTYSYMNYGEGIYVGYKYYETRYEDVVMGTTNAGSYDYSQTVAYPLGYGLSYTSFEWSDFKSTGPNKDGDMTLSVKVTNTGSIAGKEVVQLYYQAPYTKYDLENGVEKASVNLLEFGKTSLLEPGKSEIVSLIVNIHDMASYDSKNAKTYILEAGEYFVTLSGDAHKAVNNILAAKGYTVDNGMTDNGDASMVASHTVDELVLCNTSSTGYEITNQFDNAFLEDAVYLSRSNWSVMDNNGLEYADGTMAGQSNTTDAAGTVKTKEISEELLVGLMAEGWDASGIGTAIDDPSWGTTQYGQDNGLTIKDVVGLSMDDAQWDKLMDQMAQTEQIDIVGKAGWGSGEVDSVGKPETYYMDGPQGMIDYISGGKGYQFTDQNLLGATWNKELAYQMGDLVSQEFAMKGASIWWSPAINIHRTAYSGRNFEYFSEDGVFSGIMGAQWVEAAQANGVVCQLKHFFLNDQETNRGANGRLATFANEQCIREVYLKPFQICIEDADAHGVMLSMARIGTIITPGSYNMITNVLRNEWGMNGAVITDAQSLNPQEAEQALAAGCDMVCTTGGTEYSKATLESAGGQNMLRRAAKNILYVTANSIASGSDYSVATGFPVYILLLIAYNVLTVIYMAYGTVEVLMASNPDRKILVGRGKWIMRGILWTVGAIILAVLLYMFFTTWLPVLQFALQTAV